MSALTTSVPVWTPDVAASDTPGPSWGRRIAIQRTGSRSSQALAQLEPRHDLERLEVEVRLVEAVEQHQAVGAGGDGRRREVRERRVERAELDRQRDRDRRADRGDQLQVGRLDLGRGPARVGGDVVQVQLERVGAGVLDPAGVADPAAGACSR